MDGVWMVVGNPGLEMGRMRLPMAYRVRLRQSSDALKGGTCNQRCSLPMTSSTSTTITSFSTYHLFNLSQL